MNDLALEIFVGFLLYGLVFGGVGYAIGKTKGRASEGFALGLVLCVIGWIIVGQLGEAGNKCPECLGVVPNGARRCKHCGSELTRVIRPSAGNDSFFVDRDGKTEGPFSRSQLKALVASGALPKQTLCARENDSQWIEVRTIL